RNIYAYTGYTKNNKSISVMASGKGHPSIGIYAHELFSKFGVETIIRVGTCGAYQPHINLYDILIAHTSSTDSNWAYQYQLDGVFSAGAHFDLVVTALNAAKNKDIPVHVGNVLSTDIFYNAIPDGWKKWAEMGVLAVEMESYALYSTAAKLNKKALCILTVSDSFIFQDELTSEERMSGLSRMIEIAIETAESVA
ncbi:MAG: purine-nucleoside phosphorylase, partial [Erysipelotrichia bacterium]|nr:purine-nucleoside phosphorylase [Erysipelotrichia bacterium]